VRLADRHRRFVGRVAERDLFRSVLASDRPPFNVLYVLGPGGVGKTTLLREFANTCKEAGIPTHLCGRCVLWSLAYVLGPLVRLGDLLVERALEGNTPPSRRTGETGN
jgi:hypothetical protein